MDTLVYTPTHLNTEVRYLIEGALGEVLVEGEIGNLSRPRSGHIYFSLRDESSEIRCALFVRQARAVRVPMENGLKIRVSAQPTVYEVKGSYQLIVKRVLEAERGSLAVRFEHLKKQLAAEGLFAVERKKAVPNNCHAIAVVTSPDGAAVHDVIETLRRRMPLAHVRIYPTQVAGANAATQVCKALRRADDGWADVILLVRGGGSLEDLWTFNEEQVARALFQLNTPVVTGIGHQVDLSIADMVADLRADTPTAAAEHVSLDKDELIHRLDGLKKQLSQTLLRRLGQHSQQIDHWALKLEKLHPRMRLNQARQRLRALRERYREQVRAEMGHRATRLHRVRQALHRLAPSRRIQSQRHALLGRAQAMRSLITTALSRRQQRLAVAHGMLLALSPQATLNRGYAYLRSDSGQIIRDERQVADQQALTATLAHGSIKVLVTKTHEVKRDD